MMYKISKCLRLFGLSLLLVLAGLRAFADDKIYPDRPSPPRLVNDFAQMLNGNEAAQLEGKLEEFARSTSTQITIVTIKNLGGHDEEEYSVEVFNRWGLGQTGKNNGVLLLVSLDDRKGWITVGKGLEGVLTDAKSGLIFRNELVPAFKQGNYYEGLLNASEAIIAVTKGEYSAQGMHRPHHIPFTAIIILIVFIVFILRMFGGGSGGGNYMSGGGFGGLATGFFLGNMLGGGGWGDRGGGGDGGGFGGGGFGGFGGGSTGGGGAGGSW